MRYEISADLQRGMFKLNYEAALIASTAARAQYIQLCRQQWGQLASSANWASTATADSPKPRQRDSQNEKKK